MENWIGIGIWIVMGAVLALATKPIMKLDEEAPGHTTVLMLLGAFGAVIGGMLGVGIFEFYEPTALSIGGMASAAVFSIFIAGVYRFSIRSLI